MKSTLAKLQLLLAAPLAVLFVVVSTLASRHWQSLQNSDQLYPVALYRDIFVDGFGLHNWWLQPAPAFFPNLVLFFPMLAVVPDPGYAYLIWTIALGLVIGALLLWIFRQLMPWRPAALLALAVAALLAAMHAGGGEHTPTLLQGFYSPAFHVSAILNGLALIALMLHVVRQGSWPRAVPPAIVLVVGLGYFSDRILLPQFVLPVGAALVVGWLIHRVKLRDIAIFTVLVLAGLVLAFAIKFFVVRVLASPIPAIDGLDSLNLDPAQLAKSAGIVALMLRMMPLALVALAAWAALAIAGLVAAKQRRGKANDTDGSTSRAAANGDTARETAHARAFVELTLLFSLAATVLVPASLSLLNSIWDIRYLSPLALLPLVLVALRVSALRGQPREIAVAALLLAACAGSAVVAAGNLGSFSAAQLKFPYPGEVAAMDRLARERGLQYGFSDYWNAKRLTYLSREGVRVYQLQPDLYIRAWIANLNWYVHEVNSPWHPRYEFIVTNNLDEEVIRETFGEPAEIFTDVSLRVFIYDRPSDAAFRDFLLPRLTEWGMDPKAREPEAAE